MSRSKSSIQKSITHHSLNTLTPQQSKPNFFITPYGPKLKTSIDFTADGDGRTKQSFKVESDINHIMARYAKTGVVEFANQHAAQYGDCTGLEFQAGMETIVKAQALFADLPAALRKRFENDPGQFLDFVNNEENREEARKLGLLRPEDKVATPVPAPSAGPQGEAPEPTQGAKKGSGSAKPPTP